MKTHNEMIQLAITAYRAACVHENNVDRRWVPKYKKLSKLNEFHSSRVARENAYYWRDELKAYAGEVLLSVVRGEVPESPVRLLGGGDGIFERSATKDAQKVFAMIEAVRHEVEEIAKRKK